MIVFLTGTVFGIQINLENRYSTGGRVGKDHTSQEMRESGHIFLKQHTSVHLCFNITKNGQMIGPDWYNRILDYTKKKGEKQGFSSIKA